GGSLRQFEVGPDPLWSGHRDDEYRKSRRQLARAIQPIRHVRKNPSCHAVRSSMLTLAAQDLLPSPCDEVADEISTIPGELDRFAGGVALGQRRSGAAPPPRGRQQPRWPPR